MAKFMNNLYKNSVWVLLFALLLAYMCYNILIPNGNIEYTLTDYRTYIHLIFVIMINVTMVTGAYDSGLS